MILVPIHQCHTDAAWNDGASDLVESVCDECTIDQLKMLIARGERQLVRLDEDGKTVGWGVFRVDGLPNFRVLFVTNLVGHHSGFERFFAALKKLANDLGCSRIRFACKPAQERLYRMKLKSSPVYQVCEVIL